MKVTEKVLRGELIGCKVRIIRADNTSMEGIAGSIIDETKHTLTVDSEGKKRIIMKSAVDIELESEGQTVAVSGRMLAQRPEDRVKRTKNG